MAGLPAIALEIGDGGGVRRQDAQTLPRRHGAQRAIGAQHGQRADEILEIKHGFAHAAHPGPGRERDQGWAAAEAGPRGRGTAPGAKPVLSLPMCALGVALARVIRYLRHD